MSAYRIKYLDQHQFQRQSSPFVTREQAVRQAAKWDSEKYHTVLAIVGPSGEEEPWADVKPKM
jgi:hypothetical protein